MRFQRFNTEPSHLLLTILFIFLLSGCVSMGRRIEPEKLSLIKEGETTKSEVLKLLGKPFMAMPVSEYPGGETISYMYTRASPTANNFIPVVNVLSSSTKVEQQQVQITLDSNGIVRKVFAPQIGTTEVRVGILE